MDLSTCETIYMHVTQPKQCNENNYPRVSFVLVLFAPNIKPHEDKIILIPVSEQVNSLICQPETKPFMFFLYYLSSFESYHRSKSVWT